MKALHLFCGIGVGAAGFADEGFEVCGAVDNDALASGGWRLVGDGSIWVRREGLHA